MTKQKYVQEKNIINNLKNSKIKIPPHKNKQNTPVTAEDKNYKTRTPLDMRNS